MMLRIKLNGGDTVFRRKIKLSFNGFREIDRKFNVITFEKELWFYFSSYNTFKIANDIIDNFYPYSIKEVKMKIDSLESYFEV